MSLRTLRLLLLAAGCLAVSTACSARGAGLPPGPPDPDAMVDPDVTAPGDTPSPTCSAPRATCGASCVDTRSDNSNCGACGTRCGADQSCTNGRCEGTPSCASPRTMCGASCVDTQSDNQNCGSCSNRCAAGSSCSGGRCSTMPPVCAPPRAMCGASCVDTQNDNQNCGGCGTRCASGQGCIGGRCTGGPSCAPPRTMCGASCVDVTSDTSHCGLCGFACSAGQRCTAGNCTGGGSCLPPRMMCGAACVDTSSDVANCGGCSVRCAAGQTCTAGRCVTGGTTSRAGAPCTMPDPMGGMDPACGDLLCIPGATGGFCTDQCENNASQAAERSQCGGTGSTCLTQGDPPMENSICTAACTPTASPGAAGSCRTGTVCTGWWYTHAMSRPDATGCFPFCSTNAHCAAGMQCNARRGACGTTGADLTRLPDGSPCNPTITVMVPGSMTPQNVQCRGICFALSSSDRTQGVCGSFLNTAASTACPDDPTNVQPLAPPMADNLAICIFKRCVRNADCRTPHICRFPEDASGVVDRTGTTTCNYPTASQRTGVP